MLENKTAGNAIASMPCNLCGHHDISVLATRSRSGAPLRSVICQHCGLVWSDPFPHNPREFYEKEYRVEYKRTYSPKPKHILRAGKTALARHQKIKHLLDAKQSILDVGTGGGEFAYLMSLLGHQVQGIEPNEGYAEYSIAEYRLNLQRGFIQDSYFNNDGFDIITIWHVLEHTEDPYFVLRKLHSFLKPQGILVVEVPNIEATCQSPNSTFHEAHLFNFNFDTLNKLGEKAGLKTIDHIYSDDSGNITVYFRKAESENIENKDWSIPNNAERISTLIRNHTNLRHYLTIKPYQRFLRRISRAAAEGNHVRNFDNNTYILERLYQNIVSISKN